jgi:hypothetical protein
VTDLVGLDDLAADRRHAEISRQHLRDGIGDGVESKRLFGDDGQQYCAEADDQLPRAPMASSLMRSIASSRAASGSPDFAAA